MTQPIPLRHPTTLSCGFPAIEPEVFKTHGGVPYFKEAGMAMIAKTDFHLDIAAGFFETWDADLGFMGYMADEPTDDNPADLCKFAGQLCYLSFGQKRSKNADAAKYLSHIKDSGHGCYDEETEVLTQDGWKRWPDVTFTDRLATRTSDGLLEYHKPARLIAYRHEGRMYRVVSDGVDLLVTPDHKMLACITTTREGRKKDTFSLMTAEEIGLRSHCYIKTVASWEPSVDEWGYGNLSRDVMAMLGFAIGDGSIDSAGSTLRFHLKRQRKIDWLRATVSALGWVLTENPDHDRYVVTIPNDHRGLFAAIYSPVREKQVPHGLIGQSSTHALYGLYDGLMESDGCVGRTGDCFDTTSSLLAGQFQQLCLHLGFAANICYTYGPDKRGSSFGTRPLTRVSVIKRKLKPEVNKTSGSEGRSYWVEDWSGPVYCAEVPNNTLYVRRKGKTVWSGNSVFEHANYTFLFWGIDRAVTHELIRHRAGFGFSQVSQRYCDGKTLRFVEPAEYQVERLPDDATDELVSLTQQAHHTFERRIVGASGAYEGDAIWASRLMDAGHPMLPAAKLRTERRKRANQVVRRGLPNCTEAPIVVTGNARAWRNFVDQRANAHADIPIRELAVKTLRCLHHASPLIFGDYQIQKEGDGVESAATKWRKV